jgi:putative ABC transport system permease protein
MTGPRLPRFASFVFRSFVPIAERDEVLGDLQDEYTHRASADGRWAARLWIWRQTIGSLPALAGRTWWRGMTGFEPRASRMQPGGSMFESWIMDARYAVRRLARRPTYALLAVLTLALGAGGTAAIYSVVRTLLLDPLPIVQEEKVGVFWFSGSWTEQEFLRLRGQFPGFQRVAAYRPNDSTLETPGAPLRLVEATAVSAELFDVLGAQPMLGRLFREGDDARGTPLVVILSHTLWQELGADPSIVGKTLQLGGFSRTIVGVMPRGFWFPSPSTRLWTAAQLNPQNRAGIYTLVGRVADDVSLSNLDGPLQSLATTLRAEFKYPEQWDKTKAPSVEPAREFFVGEVRPSLIATLAAMGVILLIACGNVAALMLGQMDSRSTEIAIRAALGANRRRLIQQLLLESIVIGLAAGLAGALFAAMGFTILLQSLPLGALAETAHLDWTVFWASVATALVAGIAIAAVPGVALWRGNLQSTMATTRTGGIAARGGKLEGGLVVAQMALAVLLAAAAGLLIRTVANLHGIDPGTNVADIAVVDATMPVRLNANDRRRTVLDAVESLATLPGVKAVAATQKLPLRGSGDNYGIAIQGRPDVQQTTTAFRMVTRNYFDTMGIPLRAGRTFDISDRDTSDPVVVINEALAAKYFPGENPIGRVLLSGFGQAGERIVGIVGNAAEADLTDEAVPARYMLYDQLPFAANGTAFALRVARAEDVPAALDAARLSLARAGSQLAVQQTTSMRAVFDKAVGPVGRVVTLLSILAGLALVLGAVGVYGVISHYVSRRSRDYGICIAIGMPPSRVVSQVVGRGLSLVAAGSVLGLAAAIGATRVLASLLYGVRPTDPLALGGAVVILLVIGALAAFAPARRASLTDPAVVLRQP